jgi:hypothetical protein
MKRLTLGLLLLVWLIFSHKYFLQGLVPFPSRYLIDYFPPWNNVYGIQVKNNAMPDVINQLYPWKKITIDSWQSGELPRWNPYQFAGNPHLSNYQSAVFSPVNLLFLTIPFIDAWSIMILLQPLLAGLFMYLCAQSFDLSKKASVFAGISFMFCGFITVWMAYGTLGYAVLFLPLLFYAINQYIKKPAFFHALLITISIACSFLSGHVQSSIYVLIMSIIYLFYQYRLAKDKRAVSMGFVFVIIGCILALPQIIPSYTLLQQSVRNTYFQGVGGISWQYLITLIAPDFFGNPVTRNDWFGYYAEWTLFSGGATVLLAFAGVLYSLRRKIILFFEIVIILVLLATVKSPILEFIGNAHIPFFSTVSASRAIFILNFSLAILAGFGFDSLEKVWSKKLVSLKNVLLVIPVWIIIVVWAVLFSGSVLGITTDYPNANTIAVRNLLLPTGILFSTALVIFFGRFIPKRISSLVSIVLLCIVSFDMLRFSLKWMPFDEREYIYPSLPVLEYLKTHAGTGRVFQNIGGEAAMSNRLYGIEGYDPLYIKRYGELVRSSEKGLVVEAERSVVHAPANGDYSNTLFDLLGVTYIVHSRQDKKAGWVVPFWNYPKRYSLVYQDDLYEIYKNNYAFPRVFVAHTYLVKETNEEILQTIYKDSIDLQNVVVLESEQNVSWQNNSCDQDGGESAEIISYTPNHVTISVQSPCPGFLFLSDNYYPDWRAFVNSEKADIFRADYTFRAVEIPQGTSLVEFKI